LKNQELVKARNQNELQTDKCLYVSGAILKARESVTNFQQSRLEEATVFKRSLQKELRDNNKRMQRQLERKRKI
jgi:hypothetical protein